MFTKSYTELNGTVHANAAWAVDCMNLSVINKTATFTVRVYDSAATYIANKEAFIGDSPLLFIVNDPAIFDQAFNEVLQVGGAFALVSLVESYILSSVLTQAQTSRLTPIVLSGGYLVQYSPVYVVSAEVGLVGSDTVDVVFSDDITALDVSVGATVTVNGGSPIAPSLYTQPATNEVRYEFASDFGASDVVLWSYTPPLLDPLVDNNGALVVAVSGFSVTNTIGERLWFDDPANSAYAVLLLV